MLVHAHARGEHARPDVGNVDELQHALNRAVFAERPVQNRKNDVNDTERTRHAVFDNAQVVLADAVGPQDARAVVNHDWHVARLKAVVAHFVARQYERSLAGDSHRYDLVPVSVNRAEHSPSRHAADRMLA